MTGRNKDEGGWARDRREKSWLVLLLAPGNVKGADRLHIVLSRVVGHRFTPHLLQPEDSAAPSLQYLSRLAPHKEMTEKLAGRAAWVPGNKSKLAGGWVPGGIEDALQSMGHEEHLRGIVVTAGLRHSHAWWQWPEDLPCLA